MEKFLEKVLQYLEYFSCMITQNDRSGFGDATKSHGGTITTTTSWQEALAVLDKPCTLTIRNTGAVALEIAANDQALTGEAFTLAISEAMVIDNFRGRMYVRSSAAGSFNWYVWAKNVS